MALAILMPVYNEPGALIETLRAIRACAPELSGITVFLVDDGSDPAVDPACLPGSTAAFGVVFARHSINLGQGAALETARQLALASHDRAAIPGAPRTEGATFDPLHLLGPPFSAFVTMDADGQHRPEDLPALVAAIEAGADVALGSRFRGDSNVPRARRVVIHGARLFERAITGLRLSDAHNGYRAFGRRALEQVHLRENRMAHATEITMQISRATRTATSEDGPVSSRSSRNSGQALRVVEVPVSVRYSRRTLAKGQTSLGAFTILRDLFYRYLFEEPE